MAIDQQLRGRPKGITLSHFEFDYELVNDDGNLNPAIAVRGALPWQPVQQALGGFDVLRFMNWQKTNVKKIQVNGQIIEQFIHPAQTAAELQARDTRPRWRDEYKKEVVTPGRWVRTKGVPLAVCLRVAAACQAHPWLNIPHGASPAEFDQIVAYITTLAARELAQRGAAHLTPIYEYSNEVWNGDFGQQGEIANLKLRRAVESAFKADEGGTKLRSALEWQTACTNAIAERVRDGAFVVLASQTTNPWITQQLLAPGVSQYVDAVAVAPYFGRPNEWRDAELPKGFHPLRDWRTGEVNIDLRWPYESIENQLAINIRAYIDQKLAPALARHKALIDQANRQRSRPLRFWTYEGGLDLPYEPRYYKEFDQQAAQTAILRFNRSEAAGQLVAHMLNTFRNCGGELFVGYSTATAYQQNDYFGHIDLQHAAAGGDAVYHATPRLRALLA